MSTTAGWKLPFFTVSAGFEFGLERCGRLWYDRGHYYAKQGPEVVV